MATDLDEITARLDHCEAETHATRLAIREFFHDAKELRTLPDPDSDALIYQLRMSKPLPIGIPSRLGTTVHEIRACLDALACRLAERNGKSPTQTYFPVSKNAKAFKEDGLQKIRKLSNADIDTIAEMEPHGDARPFLFGMHEFDRVRKHQRLNVTFPGDSGVITKGNGLIISLKKYGTRPLTDEWQTVLVGEARGELFFGFGTHIAFAEPAQIAGMNVLDGLERFLAEARAIVAAFS